MKPIKILTFVLAIFVFQSVANPNYLSELVGFDCKRATIDMPINEVRAIKDCLGTQANLIQKTWDKLKADGKVSPTSQLKNKINILIKKVSKYCILLYKLS